MSRSGLQWVRVAAIGALVMALALAGCGRKGGLDPPPGAAATADTTAAENDTAPGIGRNGRPAAAAPKGEKKSIFLDWLID